MSLSEVRPRGDVLPFRSDVDHLVASSSGWTRLRPERRYPIALPSFVGEHAARIAAQSVFARGFFRAPELCLSKYRDVTVLPHQFILTDTGLVSGDSLEETVVPEDQVWFSEEHSFESGGRTVSIPRLSTHQWHTERNFVDISGADGAPVVRIDDTVLSIMSWYPSNVSHWLVDILARLWALDVVRSQVSKIMVPAVAMPFARESLSLLGFRDDDIIWFSNKNRYEIASLYVPSRVASHYNYFTPEIAEFYDGLAAHVPGFRPGPDPLVYVSRRDSAKRSCLNEPELEERIVDLGFRSVCLSDLSFEDRINTFAGAKVVAGACGAGLAHSLMMPSHSCLFVTGTPEMHRQSTLFLNIASQKAQQVSLFAGLPVEQGHVTEVSWEIDVDDAVASLERVVAIHEQQNASPSERGRRSYFSTWRPRRRGSAREEG